MKIVLRPGRDRPAVIPDNASGPVGMFSLLAVLCVVAPLLLSGCDRKNDAPVVHPHPVGVMTVGYTPVTVHTTLPGRVSALRVAEVRPQVSGIILHRRFTEGTQVKAGDILWQIDPAPYQAALAKARGELTLAQAAAAQAQRTVTRYQALRAPGYVSQEELDQARAQAQQADAQVQVAQAGVERAQIDLGYTGVTAPIGGTIGKSIVTEGALVTAGQPDALAVIQQLDTVYVDLTWTADDWMRLHAEVKDGSVRSRNGRLPVVVTQDTEPSAACQLLFTDVTVDESTGSLTLRAECPNPGHNLLPGMYVRATLTQGIREKAMLVPQQAVSRTPDGTATVIVVNAKNQAELRQVVATDAVGDRWRVTSGLQPGERIVVTGQMRLRPGMAVAATDDPDFVTGKKGA